jgi:hypothetical protein
MPGILMLNETEELPRGLNTEISVLRRQLIFLTYDFD